MDSDSELKGDPEMPANEFRKKAGTNEFYFFRYYIFSFSIFRIGVAMKRSSALKRCAARGSRMETEAEIAYNKGRQTVIRMLGK